MAERFHCLVFADYKNSGAFIPGHSKLHPDVTLRVLYVNVIGINCQLIPWD
jgi:hypothetical protein